jgi:hypothetical protein
MRRIDSRTGEIWGRNQQEQKELGEEQRSLFTDAIRTPAAVIYRCFIDYQLNTI